jgi:hypothetical protein
MPRPEMNHIRLPDLVRAKQDQGTSDNDFDAVSFKRSYSAEFSAPAFNMMPFVLNLMTKSKIAA